MSIAGLLAPNSLPVDGFKAGYIVDVEAPANVAVDLLGAKVSAAGLADGTYLLSAHVEAKATDNTLNDCYIVNAAIKVAGGVPSIIAPVTGTNSAQNVIRCSNASVTRVAGTGAQTAGATFSVAECDVQINTPSSGTNIIAILIADGTKAVKASGRWSLNKVN